MKSSAILSALLVSTALASPVVVNEKRQTSSTSNEFLQYGCREVIFIFARGSTESGNMGIIVGPEVSDGLKSHYGASNVATQGVDYAAALSTNFLPGQADPAGIATMVSLLTNATQSCPNSKIVAGGYSQGAAMTHDAVGELSSSVVSRIAGIVLFGDTLYQQSGGKITGFPSSDLKIYCALGDLVCDGTLIITAAHLSYGVDATDAANFLIGTIGS
ncbi:cutinase [Xylariales sp. PMI_506]|nr:cutinase [Xylariales sp. PMI_506]